VLSWLRPSARLQTEPDITTVDESGDGRFNFRMVTHVLARKGTPEEHCCKLNAAR